MASTIFARQGHGDLSRFSLRSDVTGLAVGLFGVRIAP
jgi:hypothetical protein